MGIIKNTTKSIGSLINKNLISQFNPVLGGIEAAQSGVFSAGIAALTGVGKGLIGQKPSFKTKNILTAPVHGLSYAAAAGAVGIAKPLIVGGGAIAAKLAINTPKDLVRQVGGAADATRGAFNAFFKKGNGGPNEYLGYKARALTPMALTAGAAAIGAGLGVKDHNKDLAKRSLVNGIMDTQGVHVVPGSVNSTYTPMSSRKPVKNFGADGLGFALHKNRRG